MQLTNLENMQKSYFLLEHILFTNLANTFVAHLNQNVWLRERSGELWIHFYHSDGGHSVH